MITLIHLDHVPVPSPLLSEPLLKAIRATLDEGKNVLLYYNRRGEASGMRCQDCDYIPKCEHCHIPLALHREPSYHLQCHQCNTSFAMPNACPKCGSILLKQLTPWIQKIESSLESLFSVPVIRVDSETKKEKKIPTDFPTPCIVVGTQLVTLLPIENIGMVGILLFERELSIPEYDMEAKLYTHVAYNIKKGANVFIQTRIMNHPLLKILSEGNYRDYLIYAMNERKDFEYPPYADLAEILIRGRKEEEVMLIRAKLLEFLVHAQEKLPFEILGDTLPIKQLPAIFQGSIRIKGQDISPLLPDLKLFFSHFPRKCFLLWK